MLNFQECLVISLKESLKINNTIDIFVIYN